MIDYGDFPDEIQHLIHHLEDVEFEITYGEVEQHGGPGFVAKRGEMIVQVTDRRQTWFVTLQGDSRPRLDEMWDRPRRVRAEVEDWLDAAN